MTLEARLCWILGMTTCVTTPPRMGGERIVYELGDGMLSSDERVVVVANSSSLRGIGERGEQRCTAFAEPGEIVALFRVDEDASSSRPCRWAFDDVPVALTWAMDRQAIGSPIACAME